jgi:hypothetical protein
MMQKRIIKIMVHLNFASCHVCKVKEKCYSEGLPKFLQPKCSPLYKDKKGLRNNLNKTPENRLSPRLTIRGGYNFKSNPNNYDFLYVG